MLTVQFATDIGSINKDFMRGLVGTVTVYKLAEDSKILDEKTGKVRRFTNIGREMWAGKGGISVKECVLSKLDSKVREVASRLPESYLGSLSFKDVSEPQGTIGLG